MTSGPLRILAVVNLPWEQRLGAVRVWAELAQQWRSQGHTVERFCFTDAFPSQGTAAAGNAIRQALFPYHVRRFIRAHPQRFDVIDALLGTIPFPKKSLGFPGLLVARSVGLHRTYEEFEASARTKWKEKAKGKPGGAFFHTFMAWRRRRDAEASLHHADLINLPNDDERNSLETNYSGRGLIVVQPYGLTEENRTALAAAAASAAERQQKKIIAFIGMWTLRKGSRDWHQIIARIRASMPNVRFRFVGTLVPDEQVRADLGFGSSEGVELVREFAPPDLPRLLADCCLGLFPSYVEGFGLAILEQLAAGLPTIAYDAAGPRQILAPLAEKLLAPPGDTNTLATRALDILAMNEQDYIQLSSACQSLAANYSWDQIAAETTETYRRALAALQP